MAYHRAYQKTVWSLSFSFLVRLFFERFAHPEDVVLKRQNAQL